MLFGLNKHWLKLYKELNADLPDWYAGDIDAFDGLDFDMGSSSFSDGLSSSPSIDSGDFGGFGGFSGGGVGGGGGGSW